MMMLIVKGAWSEELSKSGRMKLLSISVKLA